MIAATKLEVPKTEQRMGKSRSPSPRRGSRLVSGGSRKEKKERTREEPKVNPKDPSSTTTTGSISLNRKTGTQQTDPEVFSIEQICLTNAKRDRAEVIRVYTESLALYESLSISEQEKKNLHSQVSSLQRQLKERDDTIAALRDEKLELKERIVDLEATDLAKTIGAHPPKAHSSRR